MHTQAVAERTAQRTEVIVPLGLWSEKQAGKYLGVSPDFLRKSRQRGRGPDYVRFGSRRLVRYTKRALDLYYEQSTVKLQPR